MTAIIFGVLGIALALLVLVGIAAIATLIVRAVWGTEEERDW